MKDITLQHLDRARAASEAHRKLQADMGDCVSLLQTWQRRPPRTEDLRDAASTLGTFRHHLLCHFAWEEHGGYMEPVIRHDPKQASVVASLKQDHEDLRNRSDALYWDTIRAAYGEEGDTTALARRLHDLIDRIHRHETRENALVQEVFYREAPAD
jgi:hypothetical protein